SVPPLVRCKPFRTRDSFGPLVPPSHVVLLLAESLSHSPCPPHSLSDSLSHAKSQAAASPPSPSQATAASQNLPPSPKALLDSAFASLAVARATAAAKSACQLDKKVLADVAEALVGASWRCGGAGMALPVLRGCEGGGGKRRGGAETRRGAESYCRFRCGTRSESSNNNNSSSNNSSSSSGNNNSSSSGNNNNNNSGSNRGSMRETGAKGVDVGEAVCVSWGSYAGLSCHAPHGASNIWSTTWFSCHVIAATSSLATQLSPHQLTDLRKAVIFSERFCQLAAPCGLLRLVRKIQRAAKPTAANAADLVHVAAAGDMGMGNEQWAMSKTMMMRRSRSPSSFPRFHSSKHRSHRTQPPLTSPSPSLMPSRPDVASRFLLAIPHPSVASPLPPSSLRPAPLLLCPLPPRPYLPAQGSREWGRRGAVRVVLFPRLFSSPPPHTVQGFRQLYQEGEGMRVLGGMRATWEMQEEKAGAGEEEGRKEGEVGKEAGGGEGVAGMEGVRPESSLKRRENNDCNGGQKKAGGKKRKREKSGKGVAASAAGAGAVEGESRIGGAFETSLNSSRRKSALVWMGSAQDGTTVGCASTAPAMAAPAPAATAAAPAPSAAAAAAPTAAAAAAVAGDVPFDGGFTDGGVINGGDSSVDGSTGAACGGGSGGDARPAGGDSSRHGGWNTGAPMYVASYVIKCIG
ncbi:unnamed protein product, partial [Closterium sp. NIES-54]